MFLKSLSVKGFKSFGEPSTLDLEPGVCVVVGPNGSGKSNIIDAISWVLGAQAPKAVRSQKMDDVIFAGTAKKAALGRAEVSLTIDNSAGRLPIEFTEVTITRRLFRNGDSEYELNGAPCRLLDITELLSDSGVGRTQHIIVSQGNLDGVLNARPEERRSVIEEAAGILKHRRRRERSQRRLESTEQNLVRINDMVREVRRQLGPLRKQADAARRHQGVADELRSLRIHLAGRELALHKLRMEELAAQRAELARLEAEGKRELAAMDRAVLASEAEVSGTEAVAGVQRLADRLREAESMRERARGMTEVLVERSRSIRSSMQASVDADLVASLEADAARVETELEEVTTQMASLEPETQAVAAAEVAMERARQDFETEWAQGQLAMSSPKDEPPVLSAAEVRGELGAMRSAVERTLSQRSRAAGRLAAMTQRVQRLESEAERLTKDIEAGEGNAAEFRQAVVEAVNERAKAEERLAEVTERRQATATEAGRWEARSEALSQALDEARARAGAGRLNGVDGVVGTLLELVAIDEGWAEAVEAALGEAVAAVVVDGSDAAKRALGVLMADHHGGAVVPMPDGTGHGGGDHCRFLHAPAGTQSVRAHTRGLHPGIDCLLDRLLEQAWCAEGEWVSALDLAIANPSAVIVTSKGDRFAMSSWRVGSGAVGATGAAIDEARQRAAEAQRVADQVATSVAEVSAEMQRARQAEREASRARSQAVNRAEAAKSALDRLANERRDVAAEVVSLTAEVAELDTRAERDRARVAELEVVLPNLEAEEAHGRERALATRAARSRLDQQIASVASRRRDLDVRSAGLEQRRTYLLSRRDYLDRRLERLAEERAEAEIRRRRLEMQLRAIEKMGTDIEVDVGDLDLYIGALRAERESASATVRAITERLEGMRRERAAAEQRLSATRERSARAEINEAEIGLKVEALVGALRCDLDVEPETAMSTPLPELPPATSAESRVRELDRDLRLMGPVNPLAIEELAAVEERAAFVQAELDDVQKSRRELAKVIRAIDAEIVTVFAAAYADVADNFEKLFAVLFPGGTSRVRLTNPDDLLNTGVEIEARPSGKNVRSLQLLSGGERSLVAMAYLFSVFRSRPSPFYCMDEVEAALDDVNLHRFLGLLDEFRSQAQLIVVSHQKRTMEAADCLYGVTMQPGGSSKVVSERVRSV